MNITACYVIHGNNKSFRPVDDMLEKNINKNATAVARRDSLRASSATVKDKKINFINIISKETESKNKKHTLTTNPYEVPNEIQNRRKDGIFTHPFIRYTACSGGGGGGAACGSVIQF